MVENNGIKISFPMLQKEKEQQANKLYLVKFRKRPLAKMIKKLRASTE